MEEKLPDITWHIGYAKKDEDDPRRHKARCIFYGSDKTCRCVNSLFYIYKCGGSAHCRYYKEAENIYDKDLENLSQNKLRNKVKNGNNNIDKNNSVTKKKKKWSLNRLKVEKNGNICPACGKGSIQASNITIIDKTGCYHVIQVKKCECGEIYLTKKLAKALPSTIKSEIYRGSISLKRSGFKILSYDSYEKPFVKMVICPECKKRCNSLFNNKGMCWQCYKKRFQC